MINTPEGIDYTIDIIATKLAEQIAEIKNISQDDAIKYLLSTVTYKMLLDKESKLYTESVEYILDKINSEENRDINGILEV